jgi:FkbM family methyltransferase
MASVVNWVQLWKAMLMSEGRFEAFNPKYWENHVNTFVKNTVQMSDLTKKQLDLLQLPPESSVIEVGGGTGRIAIPIAKRVKQVTVVEPSLNMLTLLKENSKKQNVANISIINKAWEEVNVGVDVPVHDVALASFSLFMADIEGSLKKLTEVAKHRVYIFSLASTWVEKDIQRLIYGGISPLELPDYLYIYHILHELDILPNVEICEYNYDHCFNTFEECLTKFLENYNVPFKKVKDAESYLRSVVVEENGLFWLKRNQKMAVLWWDKASSNSPSNVNEQKSNKRRKLYES